jgi:hypothetical protein
MVSIAYDSELKLFRLGELWAATLFVLLDRIFALIGGALQDRKSFFIGEEFVGLTLLGDDLVGHEGNDGAKRLELHGVFGAHGVWDRFLQGFVDCHMIEIVPRRQASFEMSAVFSG